MDLRYILAPSGLALAFALAGCGGGGGGNSSTASAPPPVSTAAVDITPCLSQTVYEGRSVAQLVVPDVLQLDMAQPSGFPNGRMLKDPVIDVELAVVFLDLKSEPATTFANLPLDPTSTGVAEPTTFPYLSPATGGAPAAGGGSGFVFRTDPATAYTRVDRMGMPAVSTALIATASKSAYNDDNPAVDATGKWVPTIKADLTTLTTELIGQFRSLGLKPCATGGTGS
jgi:hypothetical protein